VRVPGGFYLVMEGADGCGKSTQYNLLADRLSGEFDVLKIREPGTTALGEELRKTLLHSSSVKLDGLEELFLFSAGRASAIREDVIPALADGRIVLSDRNCYSTEAYQGAGGSVDQEVIRHINSIATRGVSPNLVIVLDVDTEVGLGRARKVSGPGDKIEARELGYHRRVGEAYREIAKRDSGVCALVDANRGIDEIHEEIHRIAKERIDRALGD